MTDFSQILQEFGVAVVEDIQDNMAGYGLGDSKLAQSLNYEVDGNEIKITAANYWQWAEKGRGPGGIPRNFYDILNNWASRRHIKFDNQDRAIKAIAWKTAREGSYLYRHPEQQRDFIQDALDVNIEKLKEKVAVLILEQ